MSVCLSLCFISETTKGFSLNLTLNGPLPSEYGETVYSTYRSLNSLKYTEAKGGLINLLKQANRRETSRYYKQHHVKRHKLVWRIVNTAELGYNDLGL